MTNVTRMTLDELKNHLVAPHGLLDPTQPDEWNTTEDELRENHDHDHLANDLPELIEYNGHTHMEGE